MVLGWGDDDKWGAKVRLVSSTDAQRLRFDRSNRLTAPPPLRLQLGFKFSGPAAERSRGCAFFSQKLMVDGNLMLKLDEKYYVEKVSRRCLTIGVAR